MEYRFSQGAPVTEEDALAQAGDMGFHSMAFDVVVDEDEPLHWHEFNSVTWVIEGTGAFRDADGKVTKVSPWVSGRRSRRIPPLQPGGASGSGGARHGPAG